MILSTAREVPPYARPIDVSRRFSRIDIMTVSEEAPPAGPEFPAASRDQWQQLVQDVLAKSGKPGLSGPEAERALSTEVEDGLPVQPLYTGAGHRTQPRLAWLRPVHPRQPRPGSGTGRLGRAAAARGSRPAAGQRGHPGRPGERRHLALAVGRPGRAAGRSAARRARRGSTSTWRASRLTPGPTSPPPRGNCSRSTPRGPRPPAPARRRAASGLTRSGCSPGPGTTPRPTTSSSRQPRWPPAARPSFPACAR